MTALQRTAAATRKIGISAGAALAFNIPGGMNVDVRTQALAAGWDGIGRVTATITSNVGSSSVGTAALTVAGTFPAGVDVVVLSGVYVVGKGGNSPNNPGVPESGGPALSITVPVRITNNGIIGGGGGGGAVGSYYGYGNGGGAGSNPGIGFTGTANGTLTNGGSWSNSNAAGGVPGAKGGNAVGTGGAQVGGAGGGLGGAGGDCDGYFYYLGDYQSASKPGDFSDQYENYNGTTYGGAAGAAVLGNANVTWVTTGTRYGPLNS